MTPTVWYRTPRILQWLGWPKFRKWTSLMTKSGFPYYGIPRDGWYYSNTRE